MRKVFNRIRINPHPRNLISSALGSVALMPFALLAAATAGIPGTGLHLRISIGLLAAIFRPCAEEAISARQLFRTIVNPMDSVRYFEFDYFWKRIADCCTVGDYLDVSSPRLFTGILLRRFERMKAQVVNPDLKDLTATRRLFRRWGVDDQCRYVPLKIDEIAFAPEVFDLIVSISVIEHVPSPEDTTAVGRLWELLRPGGRLLISVPCARESFEEYTDFNEYGILPKDEQQWVFGQMFYDEPALAERIFSITGKPAHRAFFGENRPGLFFRERAAKLSNPNYPFWIEPLRVAKRYRRFNSISEMPGVGVTAMEFIKQ